MIGIKNLLNDPAALLTLVIIIVSICIIAVVIILLHRLDNEKRITRAALELKKITNSIRAGLVHFSLEDNCEILYASKGFYDILGYDKNEAEEQNKNSLLDYVDSRDMSLMQTLQEQLNNKTIRCDVRMLRKDGQSLNMLMTGNSVIGRDGKHTLSVVLVDISEQKKMQEMLLLEGERYRIAAELSQDVLFEYHIQKDEMIHTDKIRNFYALDPVISNFIATYESRRDQIHPDDWGIYLEFCKELPEGKSIINAELRVKNRLGEFIWCQLKGKTIYDDHKKPIRVIGKIVNIDTQKRELEALQFKATRDPLTGVYNKEVTIKKIDKYIIGNKSGMHMLMFIDFDNFKSINDHYGHLIGDKVLVYIIGRIKEIFSEGEIVGRIGGDEFVVFAGNISNSNEAVEITARLQKELDTSYVNEGTAIPVSASIGVALYPEAGLHYEQLMDRADQALYKVKNQGKNNYMLYSPSI